LPDAVVHVVLRLLTEDLRAAVELINRYGFADPAEVVHLVRTLDQVPSLVQARSPTSWQ
jgi:hypothetical protein